MSTEADIVETLKEAWVADALEAGHIRSTIVAERMIRERHAALDEITKLRAERDAAVLAERERCAKIVKEDPTIELAWFLAERIRALPDTPAVIATENKNG